MLTAAVARRFYLAGRSKVEIADEFHLSRFQVARLLERALASGLVRIQIGDPAASIDVDASSRLQDAFALRHSVVVDATTDDGLALRHQLGAAAADLIGEIVTATDVLGLAWARTVSAMAEAVVSLAPAPVVQLTGSLSGSGIVDSSVEVVRELSSRSGGTAYHYYAPMIVSDATTAQSLRGQREVAAAFDRFGSVTKAVVGIGRWLPGQSVIYDTAAEHDRQLLEGLDVCAEFCGLFATADGQVVETALADRMIGITATQMRAIPEVIGIPYGVDKAPAVRAALRSGLVTSLITHSRLARALLAEA